MLRKNYLSLLAASVLLAMAYAAIRLSVAGPAMLHGWNDFAPLRSGAELVGTPALYSFSANQRAEQRASGAAMKITYFRPPFYALLLKPLMTLPYPVSYWIFQLAALSCLLWFARAWFSSPWEIIALAGVPLIEAFVNGQDVAFVLALAGLSLIFARRGQDVKSGLLLALCAIKFHLFLFVPIAVVARKRWGILAGAAAGLAALTVLSFAAQGFGWPLDYLRLLRRPDMHPAAFLSVGLHGIAGDNSVVLAISTAVVIAAFAWTAARETSYEVLFGYAILTSLLIGYHVYTSDALLLLIPLGAVLRGGLKTLVVPALLFAASSVPYACIFVPGPWHILAPLSLLGALVAAAIPESSLAWCWPPALSHRRNRVN